MTIELTLSHVVERFAGVPEVVAVALAGSQATGAAGTASDADVYVYTASDLPAAQRLAIGRGFSPGAQLVDQWGPALWWYDEIAGVHIDAVFFGAAWMEDQLDRCLVRHQASLGYSTCVWHTLRVSHVLHDADGWLARLVERAQAPYPDELRAHIIADNLPILRSSPASYRTQIAKALSRNDWVSVNHRVAGLLASVFDIVFALNRMTHPGEKRLLDLVEQQCGQRPAELRHLVTPLVEVHHRIPAAYLDGVDRLIDAVEALV